MVSSDWNQIIFKYLVAETNSSSFDRCR